MKNSSFYEKIKKKTMNFLEVGKKFRENVGKKFAFSYSFLQNYLVKASFSKKALILFVFYSGEYTAFEFRKKIL